MLNINEFFEAIGGMKRKLITLALGQAFGQVIAVLLIAVMLLGLLDIQFRFSGIWYPVTAFAFLVALTLVSVLRIILPVLTWRPTVIDVARQIEIGAGEKNNELSSATRFISDNKTKMGRVEGLRETTIEKAGHLLESIQLKQLLKTDRFVVSVAIFATTVLTFLALCYLRPTDMQFAGLRIFTPWENRPWPRQFNFEFDNPVESVYYGRPVQLSIVETHGKDLEYVDLKIDWIGNRKDVVIKAKRQPEKPGFFLAHIPDVTESFYCQAFGGDGSTPKQMIEVIPKINIKNLTVTLTPPEYSQSRPEECQGIIRGIKGSSVSLVAKLDQPVQSAIVRLDSKQGSQRFELEVDDDGKTIKLIDPANPWVVHSSGEFVFELVDQQKRVFQPESVWQVICIEDNPAVVDVQLQRGFDKVSSRAIFSGTLNITDDVGISEWSILISSFSGGIRKQIIIDEWNYQSILAMTPPVRKEKSFLIDVSQITPANNQDWIVEATVVDMKGQKTTAQSDAFQVVDYQALIEYWNDDLAGILKRSRSALDSLKTAQTRLILLERMLRANNQDNGTARHLFVLAKENIQQFLTTAGNNDHGPISSIDMFLDRFKGNRLPPPEYARNLRSLQHELRNAIVRHDQQDTSLLNAANSLVGNKTEKSLVHCKSVLSSIQRSIERIEAELSNFEKWYQTQTIRAELVEISDDQSGLLKETRDVELSVIGKRFDELGVDLRKRIAEIAAGQSNIHQEFLEFQTRLSKRAATTTENDQSKQLLANLNSKKIAELMLKSAEEIGQNKVGNGIDHQANVVQMLNNIVAKLDSDIVANSNEASSSQQKIQIAIGLKEIYQRQLQLNEQVDARVADENMPKQFRDIATDQSKLRQSLVELEQKITLRSQASVLKWVRDHMQSIVNYLYQGDLGPSYRQTRESVLHLLESLISTTESFDQDPINNDSSPDPDTGDSGENKASINANELLMIVELQAGLNLQCEELQSRLKSGLINQTNYQLRLQVLSKQQKDLKAIVDQVIISAENRLERQGSDPRNIPDLPDF